MDNNHKILIIEDDHDLVEALTLILESKNYQVLKAYNTETGMKLIRREKPHLIILDVMFGDDKGKAEGFDLAIQVRQDKDIAALPILMLTSINIAYPGFKFSHETDQEFLPVDDFINKPAEPADLIKKVEKLLKLKTSKWYTWPDKME